MMDSMSGRARLARNNINILGVTTDPTTGLTRLVYEFQYRLPSGAPVWRKTISRRYKDEDAISGILDEVRELRRELENESSYQD